MTGDIDPRDGRWTPEVLQTARGDIPFEAFIDSLPDVSVVALMTAIDTVLAARGIELARTEWLKPLGRGLHEFRVRHDAGEIAHMFGGVTGAAMPSRRAILLRVFVHFHDDRRILLLNGYDKGADTSDRRQRLEIERARRLLSEFKRER
jgi:hypothetical protein